MMYVVKTMSKDVYFITKEEYTSMLKQTDAKLVYLSRIDTAININCIESVLNEDVYDEQQKRKEGAIAYLYDGTKVKRKFGQWVDYYNQETELSLAFYPEIEQEKVFSERQYNLFLEVKKELLESPTEDMKNCKYHSRDMGLQTKLRCSCFRSEVEKLMNQKENLQISNT